MQQQQQQPDKQPSPQATLRQRRPTLPHQPSSAGPATGTGTGSNHSATPPQLEIPAWSGPDADDPSSRPRTAISDTPSATSASASGSSKKKQDRRPVANNFTQQKLAAWNPLIAFRTVVPLLLILGIIAGPIGGLLWYSNSRGQQIKIDYTDCAQDAPTQPNWAPVPDKNVEYQLRSDAAPAQLPAWQKHQVLVNYGGSDSPPNGRNSNGVLTTICSIRFDVPEQLAPPVFMYYLLDRFHQNHRMYIKSFDADQLKGKALSADALTADCDPLRRDDETGKPIYPCGLIANSIFNDTISSPSVETLFDYADNPAAPYSRYAMTKQGISWESTKKLFQRTAYRPDEVVPPPNWRPRFPNGYVNASDEADDFGLLPDLSTDEPFQVWMRTAALPRFSKMARRNESHPLLRGRYVVTIRDNFPVTRWRGSKAVVLAAPSGSVTGGPNRFLPAVYVVTSGVCVLAALAAALAHALVRPRRMPGDPSLLSWNKRAEEKAAAGPAGRRGGGSGPAAATAATSPAAATPAAGTGSPGAGPHSDLDKLAMTMQEKAE